MPILEFLFAGETRLCSTGTGAAGQVVDIGCCHAGHRPSCAVPDGKFRVELLVTFRRKFLRQTPGGTRRVKFRWNIG